MAQEKQEIIIHLDQEEKETIFNLQNKLNENSGKLSDNNDKLDSYIKELKTSSDNSKEFLQEIFDKTLKELKTSSDNSKEFLQEIFDKTLESKIDEFESIFNKKARGWCIYTICGFFGISILIVLCLIFNKPWCLNIEETALYCLTAVCIVSIIVCILVHREYIQSKWVNNMDS